MKFIINKEIGNIHKDRVRILEREEDYFNNGRVWSVKYLCNVVIKSRTTEDWDLDDEFAIVRHNDSIQYRPKGIFKNTKGYFYKNVNKETIYLNENEVEEMKDYIKRASKNILNN